MKTLKNYIFESQTGSSNKPRTKEELQKMIGREIIRNGNKCDLNHIDVSGITDMSNLFYYDGNFRGDISKWDVSNVTNMLGMFAGCQFNGDISEWDVSNVKNMANMFNDSHFNSDISGWDVSNVKSMVCMFSKSKFNQDISNWKINPDCEARLMFKGCPIRDNFKPKNIE